jgi:hypothetical protein
MLPFVPATAGGGSLRDVLSELRWRERGRRRRRQEGWSGGMGWQGRFRALRARPVEMLRESRGLERADGVPARSRSRRRSGASRVFPSFASAKGAASQIWFEPKVKLCRAAQGCQRRVLGSRFGDKRTFAGCRGAAISPERVIQAVGYCPRSAHLDRQAHRRASRLRSGRCVRAMVRSRRSGRRFPARRRLDAGRGRPAPVGAAATPSAWTSSARTPNRRRRCEPSGRRAPWRWRRRSCTAGCGRRAR